MLTKEAENVAKAIPNFIELCGEVMNPLEVNKLDSTSEIIEISSKSIWLIAPFHLVVLLAIAPQLGAGELKLGYDITARFLIAISGIILIFMFGSILAFIPAGPKYYLNRANLWTGSVLINWFFSVLIGTGIILINFLMSNHFDSLHKIFSSDTWLGWLYASIVCCGSASIITVIITSYTKIKFQQTNIKAIEDKKIQFHQKSFFRVIFFLIAIFLSSSFLFFTLGFLTTVPYFS